MHQLVDYTGAEVVSVVHLAAEFTLKAEQLSINRDHLVSASQRLLPSTLISYRKQLASALPTPLDTDAEEENEATHLPPSTSNRSSLKLSIVISAVVAAVAALLLSLFIANLQK